MWFSYSTHIFLCPNSPPILSGIFLHTTLWSRQQKENLSRNMHVIFWALYVFLRGAGLKEDFSWWWWWHSLRIIWCNYTPHLFIVQTNMGQKYPGWCQNHDSIGVMRSSTQQVPHSSGNVTVCLLCAVGWQGLGWLGQQQPCPHTWPHTSPRGIFCIPGQTLRESWWFSHRESLHRGRLTITQRQFWEFCTGCNCILSPALITPPIFKDLSKSKWKPIHEVLICQKETVG